MQFRKIRIIVCAAVLLACGCQNTVEKPVRRAAKPGELRAHYSKVIEFWNKKLAADPHSYISRKRIAAANMGLARATGNEEYYREAEKILAEASKFAPGRVDDEEHALLSAAALMSRHQFGRALEAIDLKLAQLPKNLPLRLARGDALCGLGRYEECLAQFETLAQEKPGYDSWVRLAQVYEVMGKSGEAMKLIERARTETHALKPDNEAWTMVRIASIELKNEDLERAAAALKEALELYPDYYLAQEHMAEVYEKQQRWGDAKEWLEKALQGKEDPHFLDRMAVISENLGEQTRAAEMRSRAISILESWYAKEAGAHARDLAEARLGRGDPRVMQLVETDLALRPGDLRSNFVAAKAYRANGDMAKAKKHIDLAMRYASADTEFQNEAALIQGELSKQSGKY